MYLMLQQENPEDYVIATGVTTTVRDFIKMAFAEVGVELEFKGKGIDEKGIVKSAADTEHFPAGKEVVVIDPQYFRPTEVDLLIGDATKAHKQLGWQPKYDLNALVKDMMQADLELFKKEQLLKKAGFDILRQYE
jgi:GDPmannose 4,6-dehydratase